MRYKVVAWKGGLVNSIIKTDNPANVNEVAKMFKKTDADLIEVYERGSLERKIYGWTK
ncbi:unknown [Lactococcus phage Q54]|uniref:Uncharacterized protein n=1 Tax=Lactococcus phage Q54 TaxID=382685 RepID=Q0GXS9_9CAUD|nr:hypothetical protein Q54_gp43 [Lactococcus phage Q54]ABF22597.1 unknown [Lactococcus phage Q54]